MRSIRARVPAIIAPFVVACAAAFAACGPGLPPAVQEAEAKDRQDADASPDGGRCPYGELADPHRGFVRCLEKDEQDAGWLPPAPQVEQDGGASAGIADAGASVSDAGPPVATVPPSVTVGAPEYTAGEVPKVAKVLGDLSDKLASCVADHGGLSAATGAMKVQFLVRARGKAEGVEIESARGVSAEAEDCVRLLLKNRNVGAPTANPVGVTVTIDFKPGAASAAPKAAAADAAPKAADPPAASHTETKATNPDAPKPKPKKKKKKKRN